MRERDAARPLRAIVYARVSTARQAEDGLPVESQLDQCRAKAAAIGATIVREFRDDGISGRTSRRPAFQAALDFCETAGIDVFICWSTSRFARNRLDAALNKRLLDKMGVRLCYASQEFGDNDDGWLAEAIIEVIDEQYSRTIAKDTRRSMAKNAAEGHWNGGHVPFGYRAIADGKRRRLEVVETEAHLVRLIFRRYLGGLGAKSLSDELNRGGMSMRGKPWSKARVAQVLSSPAVNGRIEFQNGDERISTQAHTAIVSDEDFAAVASKSSDRRPANHGGQSRSEAAFSGMLRCGFCGEAMMTETATGRGGVRHHYYNCRSFLKGMGCASRRVRVSDVDVFLLGEIVDRVLTPANLSGLVVEMRHCASAFERERQSSFDALGAEAADVEKRLRRIYETIEGGAGLNLADVAPRLRELRARQEAIRREVDELAARVAPDVALSDEQLFAAVDDLRGMVRDCEDVAATRDFLKTIVKKASIRGPKIDLEYWPERLVAAASGGSQCVVSWLPDVCTMRTANIELTMSYRTKIKDA